MAGNPSIHAKSILAYVVKKTHCVLVPTWEPVLETSLVVDIGSERRHILAYVVKRILWHLSAYIVLRASDRIVALLQRICLVRVYVGLRA